MLTCRKACSLFTEPVLNHLSSIGRTAHLFIFHMTFVPKYPTQLHQAAAELIVDYFSNIPAVDTVLVVNSCARGQAVAESDLDLAILVKPDTTSKDITSIYLTWQRYSAIQPVFLKYKQSSQFAHIHLDIVDGKYNPADIEAGEPIDYFEVEIGNQVCYSAPMGDAGAYFDQLQKEWLPYYDNQLQKQRLIAARHACIYDLDHIPFLVKRALYFHAFYILNKALQEYLQTLFIANKTYPIAYNKWIKEQVVKWLGKPELYRKLSPILSVHNIESNEMNAKAEMLRELLNDVPG